MSNIKPDCRWSISKEYNGNVNSQFIARFCGDYISGHDSIKEAEKAIKRHFKKHVLSLENSHE